MKNIALIFLLAANFLLAGCQTGPPPVPKAKFVGIPAKDFTVTVTCSDPTTRFIGFIVNDGELDHLVGMRSGVYQISGHEISCEFKKNYKYIEIVEEDSILGGTERKENKGQEIRAINDS